MKVRAYANGQVFEVDVRTAKEGQGKADDVPGLRKGGPLSGGDYYEDPPVGEDRGGCDDVLP